MLERTTAIRVLLGALAVTAALVGALTMLGGGSGHAYYDGTTTSDGTTPPARPGQFGFLDGGIEFPIGDASIAPDPLPIPDGGGIATPR